MKFLHMEMKKHLEVGSPLVKGAKVEAELMKNSKNRTILIFKKEEDKIQEEKMDIDNNIL